MKNFAIASLLVSLTAIAHAQKSVPALWKHELSSSALQRYKKGQHLILSSIYTGTLGKDASQRYGLEVKVSSWDKPFTTTSVSRDKKQKEVLTVTLHRMKNPHVMEAIFDDTVIENGKVKLRFSGKTILYRWS